MLTIHNSIGKYLPSQSIWTYLKAKKKKKMAVYKPKNAIKYYPFYHISQTNFF